MDEAYELPYMYGDMEDKTDADIQEAFDTNNGASWDYSVSGPSPAEVAEVKHLRRERLLGLIVPKFEGDETTSILQTVRQLESYIYNG